LFVASSKSRIGHTEGAAGVHGVVGAMASITNKSSLTFQTTVHLNTFITGILDEKPGYFAIPRQFLPESKNAVSRQSVSSFGMSGTNACALLSESSPLASIIPKKSLLRNKISWAIPNTLRYSFVRSMIRMECMLKSKDAYLMDHIVGGRSIMPGAGMLDIALGSFTDCFEIDSSALALSNASISAAMLLKGHLTVVLDIDSSRGSLAISSKDLSPAPRKNASCRVSKLRSFTNNSKQKSTIADLLWYNREPVQTPCIGHIYKSKEGYRYPAMLDASIHLGPATSYDNTKDHLNQPRAVVAVKSIALPNKSGKDVTPSVTKRSDGVDIFTDHWGLSTSSTFSHCIKDLQSKVIQGNASIPQNTERAIRYAVLDLCAQPVPQSSGDLTYNSVETTLTLIDSSYHLKSDTINDTRSISLLTQIMQGMLSQRLLKEFVAKTSACRRPGSIVRGEIRTDPFTVPSYLKVLANEVPQKKFLYSSYDTQAQYLDARLSPLFNDNHIDSNAVYSQLLATEDIQSIKHSIQSFWKPRKESVVTGGMGALGTLVLDWMLMELCSSGTFLGRTGRTRASIFTSLSSTLDSRNVVRFTACDSSEKDDLMQVLLASDLISPSSSIMHAGGMLDSKLISNISMSSIRNVFAGKVSGSKILGNNMQILPIESCQMFSSLASFGGVRGQSVYAAGNAALDSASAYHFQRGHPVVAVQWGNWGGKGMAADDEAFTKMMEHMGLGMISPSDGLEHMNIVMNRLLWGKCILHFPVLMINIFKWETIKQSLTGGAPHILTDMLPIDPVQPPIPRSNANMQKSDVLEKLMSLIESMGFSIQPEESLLTAGLDSLSLQTLSETINHSFDVSLDVSEVFGYATVTDLSNRIAMDLGAKHVNRSGKWDSIDDVRKLVESIIQEKTGQHFSDDESLFAAGLNSISVTELTASISEHFSIDFPQTMLIDYPTMGDIAGYISSRIHTNSIDILASGNALEAEKDGIPVKIVSLSFAYPSDSSSNVCNIQMNQESPLDNVTQVPLNRWDIDSEIWHTRTNGTWKTDSQ
jgi:acyl carrier protein